MIALSNSWIEDRLLVKLLLHRFPPFIETGHHQRPVIYAVTLPSPRRNGNSCKRQFFLQAQIYELPKNNTISKINDFVDGNARYAIINP